MSKQFQISIAGSKDYEMQRKQSKIPKKKKKLHKYLNSNGSVNYL